MKTKSPPHSPLPQHAVRLADLSVLEVATPALAGCEVAKLRLVNGLQAYVIADPEADECAAALAVQVGSWQDPPEAPGTAHFVEHMLFMGTTQYPDESAYESHVARHGGECNAATYNDLTTYRFCCKSSGFHEALLRFASFFMDPLFNPASLQRERLAVDQEFQGDVNDDGWRHVVVEQALNNPQHPDSRFTIGNQTSLAHIDDAALRTWYETHYSANIMRLVVVAPQPLHALEQLVVETFSKVPERAVQPAQVTQARRDVSLQGHMVAIQPRNESERDLHLCWELPHALVADLTSWPALLVAHALGHEAEGSLLARLKAQHLAEGLATSASYHLCGNAEIELQVHLTDLGVAQRHKVLALCSQAITTLREHGVPAYLFDEMRHHLLLAYKFQSRRGALTTVDEHAANLLRQDLETYPDKVVAPTQHAPDKVHEVLRHMTPHTCHVYLVADHSLTGLTYDRQEPWMGVRYAVAPLPRKKLTAWAAQPAQPGHFIPQPNPFLATQLDFIPLGPHDPTLAHPQLLQDDGHAQIYWARDTHNRVPKLCWQVDLRIPSLRAPTARLSVLAWLQARAAEDALSEVAYAAGLAGLRVEVEHTEGGFCVEVEGYTDKATWVLDKALSALLHTRPSAEQFAEYTESMQHEFADFGKESPLDLGQELLKQAQLTHFVSTQEMAAALPTLAHADLTAFANTLTQTTHIQAALVGNLDVAHVKAVQALLARFFTGAAYPEGRKDPHTLRNLMQQRAPLLQTHAVPCDGNGVLWVVHHGPATPELAARVTLLRRILHQPFFEKLRTEQQTAYNAYCSSGNEQDELFTYFYVEPHHHTSRDVLARVENFVVDAALHLGTSLCDAATFSSTREAALIDWKKPPESVGQAADRLAENGFLHDGDFAYIEKRVTALTALQQQEFVTWAKAELRLDNPRRLILLLDGHI